MIEEKINLKSGLKFENIISDLEKKFPNWQFKYIGEIKKYPKSSHYHVTSKNKLETGTLEMTILPNKEIILKMASNRMGNWGMKSLKLLLTFFK